MKEVLLRHCLCRFSLLISYVFFRPRVAVAQSQLGFLKSAFLNSVSSIVLCFAGFRSF